MMGRNDSLDVLKRALHYADSDQAEARLMGEDLSLTRFANSTIHQNLERRNAVLQVRVVQGKKIGTASTNNLDDASVRRVVDTARSLAEMQEDNEDFVSLPEPERLGDTVNFYESTSSYTPEQRAQDVGVIAADADDNGLSAFGAHITTREELAVMNSLGVEAYDQSTYAYLRTVIEGDHGTGYADYLDRDVSNIDARAVAREAVDRALRAQNPQPLPTGEYEVIFEPYAVADILRFLGMLGFSALSVQEGRSFMADKFGEKITGDKITIWDDGLDARTLNAAVDCEGVPKQRVNLITGGVAEGVVYDSYTAHKEGKKSTGHAHFRRGNVSDTPANMVMLNGDSSVQEMVDKTGKGLLVTRFHYTHCPEPREVVMTGTTRDGIFYVEDGEIKYPVRNMRLTDSVLRMFEHVELVSKATKLQRDWWSTFTSVLPAIYTSSCIWTGSTEF